MIALLTDMYIASSAKGKKNKFLKREKNYSGLVYEKYKIDTTRFNTSNEYYTSKIEEYTEILKKINSNIDSIIDVFNEKRWIYDSINKKKKIKSNSFFPEELDIDDRPQILIEKNSKLSNKKKLEPKKVN